MLNRSGLSKPLLCLIIATLLSGCATTKPAEPEPPVTETTSPKPIVETPGIDTAPIAVPDPVPAPPVVTRPTTPAPTPPAPPPPDEDIYEYGSEFDELPYWPVSDPTPALGAFQQTCDVWSRRKDTDWLNPNLPAYGRLSDWRTACASAQQTPRDRVSALNFFHTHFKPVRLATDAAGEGKLTGYFAPQIDVRRQADAVFSEPVLARPTSQRLQNQPRKDINATTSRVLAYGRPIDVFFLQIQGSGQIKFADGVTYRAAFNGHNSHSYVSIGKLLVARGELTLEQASKQSIEDWMIKAGPTRARALMNENPRYIFFKTETLNGDSGPKGSMGAPLTAMGSIAVDPRYHPYGAMIWLRAKLPQFAGDYSGVDTGILVSAQDSGNAIKGPMRGDLYFGAGDEAGGRAGVMKHQAVWTLFLPTALAVQALLVS
jgi:membrane-bound lytic murein transglycosylase A